MPLWTCNFESCSDAAVRKQGDCVLCNRHLCATHLHSLHHKCPKWENADVYDKAAARTERLEIERLISSINMSELADRASSLRNGIPCSIPSSQFEQQSWNSVMGGMNYHVHLCFEDGVVWLARVRRINTTSPPPDVRDHILQSEVGTLKFLESTSVPAPKVYDFSLEKDLSNKVGVGYIIMEKMPGRALNMSTPTTKQLKRIINQLADIYIELSRYPLPLMGSLTSASSRLVSSFAHESLIDLEGTLMKATCPLDSLRRYYEIAIKMNLKLILRRELYALQPVDAYLIHRFLLDLVPKIVRLSEQNETGGPDTKFFLKHADEKGDHILVDQDFNITGIIDWEWASTTTFNLAFNSPIALLSVTQFYKGSCAIDANEEYFAQCLEEKGGERLAAAVRAGRVQHFFTFCCGYNLEDWSGFLGLFRGLREAIGIDAGIEWSEWKWTALQRYNDDEGLELLLKIEEMLSSKDNNV